MSKRIYLSDNIHNNIQITSFEKSIISTTIFNRLHNIYQNSTVFLTFPTCRHKRFEHSLGVMKLAGDSYSNSILNSNDSTIRFYSTVLRSMIESIYIENKVGTKYKFSTFLTKISLCFINENLYKDIFSNFTNDDFSVHCITYQALRFAALLHDLGHPPYSHIVENSLKKLYLEIEKYNPNERVQIFKETFDFYVGSESGKQLHEEVGFVLIDKIINEIEEEEFRLIYIKVCLFLAKKIIDGDLKFNSNYENLPNALHSLIDGEIDADRFDYVCRDAINSGFRIDNLNYTRLFSNFTLLYKKIGDEPKESFIFCPNEKTIDIIDDFFLRKDQLYSKVIYHHRSNKMGILMENVVYAISKLFLEGKIDVEFSNNQYSKSIVDNISGLWIPLNEHFYSTNDVMMIQWDDSWLNNILKKYLSDEYIKQDNQLCDSLTELVSNKKKFNSYVKRIDDFLIIDESFKESTLNRSERLKGYISDLDLICANYKELNSNKCYAVYSSVVTVRNSLVYILSEVSKKRMSDVNYNELLTQWLKIKGGQATGKILNSCIKRLLCDVINIDNITLDKKNAFIGQINHKENIKEFFLYFTKDDLIVNYTKVSAIPDFLKRQSCYSVGFHFYSSITLDSKQRVKLLDMLGNRLSDLFFEELDEFVTNSNTLILNVSSAKI